MTNDIIQDTVAWEFMRQWLDDTGRRVNLIVYETLNHHKRESIISEIVEEFCPQPIFSNDYQLYRAVARVFSLRKLRVDHFNEHIADSVGFRIMWNEWLAAVFTQVHDYYSQCKEKEGPYHLLGQRFYNKIPIPIEITDNKLFTLALLGQA